MENNKVGILLVDDHSIVRCGIRSLIEKKQEWDVCGEAENLSEAYNKLDELKPDVVLLDIKLPDGDGISGCREIKKRLPNTKVIILTAFDDDYIISEAVKSGADGYLLKNIDGKGIILAIQNVINGTSVLDTSVVGNIFNIVKKGAQLDSMLTYQERNILDLIVQGKTNKEIGQELYIAEKTVRNNVSRILKKINVSNRTEAAIYWSRQTFLK